MVEREKKRWKKQKKIEYAKFILWTQCLVYEGKRFQVESLAIYDRFPELEARDFEDAWASQQPSRGIGQEDEGIRKPHSFDSKNTILSQACRQTG